MKAENLVISGFDSALLTVKKKGYKFKNNRRASNGLMILRSGRIRYFQGNKTFISDTDHILLIPEEADYKLICDEDSETYVINFFATPISDEILSFERHEELSADAEFIISHFDGVISERMACVGRLYSVLSKLFGTDRKQIPKIIKKGVDHIEKHIFDNALTVEAAAGASGVSEVYFRRIFAESFGVSPLKYIQEKRIAKAKRSMADRSLTLESIALDCGYTSIYSFSAAFKKKEGISPSEYREKYGEL